jgi:primosomal protein N' (replication factor Y)
MVDVALPHLDRPFDYLVPSDLDSAVGPGSRVRVRFSGRLVDAYVLERRTGSDHDGSLAFVERVVGADPVLTPDTARLFRAVADRWAGSFVDVARLGIPARHAGAESRTYPPAPPGADSAVGAGARAASAAEADGFGRYRAGAAFLTALAGGKAARAVWSTLPGDDWPRRFAETAAVALNAGRGAVLVVPDGRDLERLDRAMHAVLGGPDSHVVLASDLGPSERYARWLAVRRGAVRVVIGTRSAAYAPVADLGLVAMWDDGDDLHAEPRAPYAHVRDVLVLRSSLSGTALLLGGYARTAEAQQLVDSGWAHDIVAERSAVRAAMPHITASGDDAELARDPAARAARLPSQAWRLARDALASGRPVLVQVPRRGYVPALACERDRTPARCPSCSGPLQVQSSSTVAACSWCGRQAGDWSCPVCGERRMRAVAVGTGRTAEELGRAFPGAPVRTSGGDRVLVEVPATAALVVATPGAEPIAAGGYGAALLLDAWALLSRNDLRAGEEVRRRWMNACALVRADGHIVVVADAGIPSVQALVRWDPAGAAARELAERAEVRFPPAVRMASLTGPGPAVADLLAAASLPADAEVIGPVPIPGRGRGTGASGMDAADTAMERVLVRTPRAAGAELAGALKAAAALRSARKEPQAVRIELDPATL